MLFRLRGAETEQKKLQNDIKDLQSRLEAKSVESKDMLAALNRNLNFNEGRTQTLATEKAALELKLSELRTANSKLEIQEQQTKSQLSIVQSEVTSLRERLNDVESQLKDAKADALSLRNQYAGTGEELATLKGRLAQTSEELATVKEQMSIKSEGWAIERGEMMADAKQRNRAIVEERELKVREEQMVRHEFERLRAAYDEQTNLSKNLALELAAFKKNLGAARETQLADVVKISVETDVLKRQLADKTKLAEKLREAEAKIEELTKKLHEGRHSFSHLSFGIILTPIMMMLSTSNR
jgi:chromosome segregation ATPase